MNRVKRIIKGAIALLLIFALGTVTYLRATEEPPDITSIERIEGEEGKAVVVQYPQKKDFEDYILTDAAIQTPNRYVLRSNLNERVQQVMVEVGDTVEKGDLLLQFRKEDIQADIDAAEARFEEAKKNYDRSRNLLERNIVSQDAVEKRLTAMKDARAALQKARSNLSFAEVFTPAKQELDYDRGNVQVSARYVNPGEYKSMGQELLNLIDMSLMDIAMQVPENAIRYLRKGQRVEFRLENEKKWCEAVIERVSPETEDPHRFFTIFARTENTKENGLWQLRPGMYAEARILKSEREAVMAIPSASLNISETGCCTFFVVEMSDDSARNPHNIGTVKEIDAETGLRKKDWVEIISPELRGEEKIILNPRLDISDGDKVKFEIP